MLKKLLFLCSAALILSSASFAREVGEINVPDTLAAGQNNLVINSAGVRSKFFIKA